MNAQKVLIYLSNEYTQCFICKRHMHEKKNNEFQSEMLCPNKKYRYENQRYYRCPICQVFPACVKKEDFVVYKTIITFMKRNIKRLQEIYGDVYQIDITKKDYCFHERKSE